MRWTQTQIMAQAAYTAVCQRENDGQAREQYVSFARSFPSLIHACGLAQALAFASKKQGAYLEDLASILKEIGHSEAVSAALLEDTARQAALGEYVRLSRNALRAAGWLKRYAEADGD